MTVEEEIRKHAIVFVEAPKIHYLLSDEVDGQRLEDAGWVKVKVVLGVVAQLETKHKEKSEGFAKVIARLGEERYERAKAEAERNQKLQAYREEVKKNSPYSMSFIAVWEEAKDRHDSKQRDLAYQIAYDRGVLETIQKIEAVLSTGCEK